MLCLPVSYNKWTGDFFMREKIQRKIDKLLSLLIIVLFVPLFILIVSRRVQLEELLYGTASVMAEEGVSDREDRANYRHCGKGN